MPKINTKRLKVKKKNGSWEAIAGFGGGVYPTAKTAGMTQPVGIDEQGRLFTEPSVGEADVKGTVRYDKAQELTEEQQAQARENIGAVSEEEVAVATGGKITSPDTATVGDMLTVEEVDEDGKPVKWKTAKPTAEIPTTLPNPHTLTFSGAVEAEYDGSSEVEVEIPTAPDTYTKSEIDTALDEVKGSIPEAVDVPEVFDWVKSELPFTADQISDTYNAVASCFVTNPTNFADGIPYFRYHAGSKNFTWTNPNPRKGQVTVTVLSWQQWNKTSTGNSSTLNFCYSDGTKEQKTPKNGVTTTFTSNANKTLTQIKGNYDLENWVLLDLSVLKIVANYDPWFEDSANKVTELTESSTDVQYPSAKAVYTKFAEVETALETHVAEAETALGSYITDIDTLIGDGSSTSDEKTFENLTKRESIIYSEELSSTVEEQNDGSLKLTALSEYSGHSKRVQLSAIPPKIYVMMQFEVLSGSVLPFDINANLSCLNSSWASTGGNTEGERLTVSMEGTHVLTSILSATDDMTAEGVYMNIGVFMRTVGAIIKIKDYVVFDVSGIDNYVILGYNFPQYLVDGYVESVTIASSSSTASGGVWDGKNVLFIGDSLSTADEYQSTVKSILGINVYNHCKSGATFDTMVSGDNGLDGTYSDETDSSGVLRPLTSSEVNGMHLIVLYGGYNCRHLLAGEVGDVYNPDGTGQSTYAGQLQYAINRIYDELVEADNLTCKILIVTPDCVGSYPSISQTGYEEYPAGSGQTLETLVNIHKAVAEANGLPCLDLYHTSGINRKTWGIFSASADDCVHKSSLGYARIGEKISGAIIGAYGN